MNTIVVIAHNIRSAHNVGSILRTCEGFGVRRAYLTGYTPYPSQPNDQRLPHLRTKITAQIHKTALGAEGMVRTTHSAEVTPVLAHLKNKGYELIALEQTPNSVMLPNFKPASPRLALLLGEEVHGIAPNLLNQCDTALEIPMAGRKESFNVSVAAGIALYSLSL